MKKTKRIFLMACFLVACIAGAYKTNAVKAAEGNESMVYDSTTDPRAMSDEEIAEWQKKNMRNGIIIGSCVAAAVIIVIVCSVIYDKKHKGFNGHSSRPGVSSGSSFGENVAEQNCGKKQSMNVAMANGKLTQPDADQCVKHMAENDRREENQ